MEGKQKRVCVTGAGGYIASWVVKFLLLKGYVVHGTVRDPADEKNDHLRRLEKAQEKLKLFKADLLDYSSLLAAIDRCSGVFHVACPVPPTLPANPEKDLVEPSVVGTMNVLKACTSAGVKRVTMVSSIAAVFMNPKWPQDQDMNEDCWTDIDFCKTNQQEWMNWYSIAKTRAEIEARKYSEENGIKTVVICPSLVLGPLLQPTINTSILHFLQLFKAESLNKSLESITDVRDVAEAILLLHENDEADGRYICSSHTCLLSDLAQKLKTLYPTLHYPKRFSGEILGRRLSSEKLKRLGWSYRPLEATLTDTVEWLKEASLIREE